MCGEWGDAVIFSVGLIEGSVKLENGGQRGEHVFLILGSRWSGLSFLSLGSSS